MVKPKGGKKRANQQEKENVGVTCTDILPMEIWKKIISRLNYDFKSLFKCRLISAQLKVWAEEEMAKVAFVLFKYPPQIQYDREDPWALELFEEDNARRLEFVRFIKVITGIHFNTVGKIRDFITSSEKAKVAGSNFPNGCAVFYPEYRMKNEDILELYNSFQLVVNAFSEDITTLVYQIHHLLDTLQFFEQLRLIFRLKNLKHLVIFYSPKASRPQNMDFDRLNNLIQGDGVKMTIPVPTGLKDFYLREFPLNINRTPLIVVFKNFIPDWENLTHLCYNWNSSINMDKILEQMMDCPPTKNLCTLELQNPSPKLLEYSCLSYTDQKNSNKISPRMDRLYLRFNKGSGDNFGKLLRGCSKEESKIIQVFTILDASQAGHLQALNLDLYIPLGFRPKKKELSLNYEVKYEKLTELRINFITLLRWESLLIALHKKFPSLKEINIETSYDCLKILNESDGNESEVRIVGFYQLVCRLWNIFPALKDIKMAYYEWELKKNADPPANVIDGMQRLLNIANR